jgi:DNA-binding beta-propeller fold protein YncE
MRVVVGKPDRGTRAAGGARRAASGAVTRRAWLKTLAVCLGGCAWGEHSVTHVELVWGGFGSGRGQFQKPRAIAIDAQDRLYIVDTTARIQVFDRDGRYLRGWRTPDSTHGNPSGLSFDREGNLLVADTHYYRVLIYQPTGRLLSELGGRSGTGPGEFNFVTDAVQDEAGNYYISEYGNADRIQKISARGEFLYQWGGTGEAVGQFRRPNNLALDQQHWLWVADASNHRIQVFDVSVPAPQLVTCWGNEGTAPGQLRYPYDVWPSADGYVYVAEFGNHRVQKFTREGQPVALAGGPGRNPGQFYQPWALAIDSQGALHVLDTYNHRVQRIRL